MTRFDRIRPMLEANDVGETVAFYTDVLGFTCVDSIEEKPGEAVWASLVREDTRIMFTARHTHDEGDGGDHGHDHPEQPVMTGSLYFDVDDVDRLAIDLGGKVALEFGPQTMPYGMREIAIVDPNGYFLLFGAPVAE